jgi:hypothetical protein
MGLDLRWPIGIMFFLLGLLLVGTGVATSADTAMYQRSLGININLYWGLFLTVFGAVMMGMAWYGGRNAKK